MNERNTHRDGARGWLEALTTDPLLSDYLGLQAWRRWVEVRRDASRQLGTFNPKNRVKPRVTQDKFLLHIQHGFGRGVGMKLV